MISNIISIIAQQLFIHLNSSLDSFTVSRLGSTAIAALGSASRFIFIVKFSVLAFAIANAAFSSQSEKDKEKVSKYLYISVISSLLLTLCFIVFYFTNKSLVIGTFTPDKEIAATAAQYIDIAIFSAIPISFTLPAIFSLRSINAMKAVTVSTFLTLVTNGVLNFYLTYPMNLGVRGAAIATLISEILGMLLIVSIALIGNLGLFANRLFDIDRAEAMSYLRKALVVFFSHIVWALFGMRMHNLIGQLGSAELTAFGAFVPIELLLYEVGTSLGYATLVFTGKSLSQGKKKEAYAITKKFLSMSIVAALILALAVFLLKGQIVNFYKISKHERELFSFLLKNMAIFLTIKLISPIFYNGCLRAGGDMTFILVVTSILAWGLIIPLSHIGFFFFNFGLKEIYITICVSELVILIPQLIRFRNKKWMNKL